MGVIKIDSGYKEKSTVGLSDLLWDSDGNHYIAIELGCVLGLDDISGKLVWRYKMTTTKSGKLFITKRQKRVYLTTVHTPDEVDLKEEESLWSS